MEETEERKGKLKVGRKIDLLKEFMYFFLSKCNLLKCIRKMVSETIENLMFYSALGQKENRIWSRGHLLLPEEYSLWADTSKELCSVTPSDFYRCCHPTFQHQKNKTQDVYQHLLAPDYLEEIGVHPLSLRIISVLGISLSCFFFWEESPGWPWTPCVADDGFDFWSFCSYLSSADITGMFRHTRSVWY